MKYLVITEIDGIVAFVAQEITEQMHHLQQVRYETNRSLVVATDNNMQEHGLTFMPNSYILLGDIDVNPINSNLPLVLLF